VLLDDLDPLLPQSICEGVFVYFFKISILEKHVGFVGGLTDDIDDFLDIHDVFNISGVAVDDVLFLTTKGTEITKFSDAFIFVSFGAPGHD
jgi:hypothetical protein